MSRILIVDDEKHIRLLLERALKSLEEQGVELLMADNGDEAMQAIVDKKPELVFLDIMLPKMSGYDLCKTVKKEMGLDVYIIVVTAKGQDQDKARGIEVGADEYITKPFNPIELLSKAKDILGLD